jgi:hypothetical protein
MGEREREVMCFSVSIGRELLRDTGRKWVRGGDWEAAAAAYALACSSVR